MYFFKSLILGANLPKNSFWFSAFVMIVHVFCPQTFDNFVWPYNMFFNCIWDNFSDDAINTLKINVCFTQGWQFLGEFHSSRNRGVEEWQIYIPRGSRNMKSIPRGPRGISRNKLSQKSLKKPENPPKILKNSEK